jgi:hypothetical protein
MGRCRFVRPETTILPISDGDTLVVRKRLTHGERQASVTRMYSGTDGRLNPEQIKMAVVTAYLLDWSLVGFDQKQIVIRDQPIEALESALNNLDPDDFDEIKKAIEAHANAVQDERMAEQKKRASSTTSTSPAGAAGATSGSNTSIAMSTT